jgi:cell division protein FtsI/penicillin-binding protein 2
MDLNSRQRRVFFLAWGFGCALTVLGVRLVFVQCLQPTFPNSQDDTGQRIIRPARRGDVLDARGTVLSQSRLFYEIYADPVVIGTNAAAVAAYAAPILGKTEAELMPLLTLRREARTNWVTTNIGAFRYTNALVRSYTNRSVLVVSNVEPSVVARYRDSITNLVFPRYGTLRQAVADARKKVPGPMDRVSLMLHGQGRDLKTRSLELSRLRRERDALGSQQREVRINGLIAVPVEQRVYPLGIAAAHVLGYTTNDSVRPSRGVPVRLLGATGIENRFDTELQGVPGLLETHKAKGRELVPLRGRDLEARDGLNVRLTIDSHLQSIVEQALDDAVLAIDPKAITCVMVRPKTGEILAMANRPTYDPNQVRFAPVDHRMNRAITVPSEPGSTFKMLTYAAGLDLGLATIDEMVDCEHGRWQPPSGRPVRDVEGHGLGMVKFEEAFAKSSNVAAAKLGLRMSSDQMIAYMRRFGFLQRSGIMYSTRNNWGGEHPGSIPEPHRINVERQGRMSYGYGFYATPLQTAMAAAAIANDGVLMKPLLVRSVETSDGRVVTQYAPARASAEPTIRPETAAQMRRAMRSVVTDGTGKITALEDYDVSGKTGTAHKVDPITRRQSNEKYTATFVGFLPSDNPEICILVLADEPSKRGAGSYYGGKACGPVFRAIAQQAASYLAMQPSLRMNSPSNLAETASQPIPRVN